MASCPSPGEKSPAAGEQAEKQRQYDRQIRLWGDRGQGAVEGAHVCCIGGGPLATETLKSLVLPGIGAFTLVDDVIVTHHELGCNFFLEPSSVGKSRAGEVVRLLLELNPATRGTAVTENADTLLQNHPDFFKQFTCVIATDLSEKVLVSLSEHLWRIDVPLIACRSVGFLSSLRLQVVEHAVFESHPDDLAPDLRLDRPFPELVALFGETDIRNGDPKDRAHVPWLLVLMEALEKWRETHENRWPQSRREKEQVKDVVRNIAARDDSGRIEANFEEAIHSVNGAVVETRLPASVRRVLYDEAAVGLTRESSPFWIACAALRGFVENEGGGLLPLRGSVPDMTASTDRYVRLQKVYRAAAVADAEAVWKRARELARNVGAEPPLETDINLACKHAAEVRLVRGSKIADEYRAGGPPGACVAKRLEESEPMMLHYALFRAAERFRSEQCRAPGEWEAEADIAELKSCLSKVLNEWNCSPLSEDDRVHEMCRYGGAELHSVSAFMGGCAAQEVIKLITKQYVPIDNFFVYDAVSCESAVYKF